MADQYDPRYNRGKRWQEPHGPGAGRATKADRHRAAHETSPSLADQRASPRKMPATAVAPERFLQLAQSVCPASTVTVEESPTAWIEDMKRLRATWH